MAAASTSNLLLASCLILPLVHGFVPPAHSIPGSCNMDSPVLRRELAGPEVHNVQALQRLRGGGVRLPGKRLVNSLKMAGGLASSAAIVGAINFIGFAVTLTTNTHKVTDLLGTGAFAISAVATFLIGQGGQRAAVSTVCVSVWSVRLAGFLFYRILRTKTDDRLANAFKTPTEVAGFWVASALWGFLCLLPHSLLCFSSQQPAIGPFGALALGVWGLGFGLESVADWQKWTFKQSQEGRKSWCQTGLWSWSRHPNYCGEILVWLANFCFAAPSLVRSSHGGLFAAVGASRDLGLAALSPLFTLFLLTKVSGVPLAEARADERFGRLPQYKAYKDRTPLLFPKLF